MCTRPPMRFRASSTITVLPASTRARAAESPASRASQIARQLLLYGRPIPMEELVDRLSKITVDRLSDLAKRLFSTTPTIAAIGPVGSMPAFETVRETLVRADTPAQRIAV